MTERAKYAWRNFCIELIDNGDKTSEDVRQALATVLRDLRFQLHYFGVDWRDKDNVNFAIGWGECLKEVERLADEIENLEIL